MRRRWRPSGRRALFAISVIAALAALLPMRLIFSLAPGAQAITARAVHGSLWHGRIEAMRVGALSLGTIDAALSPLPLVIGRARLDLTRRGQDGSSLDGAITLGHGAVGVDGLTASLATAGLFAPLPIAGLDLQDVSVRFTGGQCAHAEGRIRARLADTIPGLALKEGLSGPVRCDGARMRASLTGRSGRERVDLAVDAAGNVTADALIARPGPDLARALTGLGFTRVSGGYRLHRTSAAE